MYSLAYLDCKNILKDIVDDNPTLIYYICHIFNQTKYTSEPFIDIQEDCKKLSSKKYEITVYIPPRERPTHSVTGQSCNFSRYGRRIAEELCQKGICDEILKLLNQIKQQRKEQRKNTHINEAIFSQAFLNYFTFNEDSDKVIENKLQEIKDKFNINIPNNNHVINKNGNIISIQYSFEENNFCITFIINCICSKGEKTEIKIKANEDNLAYNRNHSISCNNCGVTFIISNDLYYCY